MAYTKKTWIDNESYADADSMNNIENGIYNNDAHIGDLNDLETDDKTNLVEAINEATTNIRAVNEGLGALTTPQKLTNVTYNPKISNANIYKIGRLIICTIDTKLTSDIANGEVLISGLPASVDYFNGQGNINPYISTNQTTIKTAGAITAGYRQGLLIYITAN